MWFNYTEYRPNACSKGVTILQIHDSVLTSMFEFIPRLFLVNKETY